MGLAAVTAFISGAGLDTPTPLLAMAALLLAMAWAPGPRLQRVLDPIWRILALALTARALYHILVSPADVVLPMVDLLLVLLVSENLKESGAADTRVYSLSFALLIAACAYRPGVAFAVSFVTYTALATVTLMVGHFIRQLTRHQAREVRLERAFLLRIAALSSVMLVMSALVFTAFPRVSRGWVMRGAAAAANVVGFSDRVSLAEHGSRIYPNPEVVLRVEFPDAPPANPRALYWRGRSYDLFDGVAWRRSPAMPISSPTAAAYSARWPGERTTQRVYAVPLDVPVLFGLHPVLRVQPQSRMRALQDNAGDLWYFGTGSPTYDVVSAKDAPSPAALRAAAGPPPGGEDFYLQVPHLSGRVAALADSLTAGATTRYDAVIAVRNWLQTEFTYTLELPATAREATLEHFLLRRRAGHCEYFSTALAIMLRVKGIPTRNVNGFLGGTWNEFGAFLTVTQNEAHSWVEVFFPGYGWVQFDGTPAAAAGTAQGQGNWLNPFRNVFAGLEHRWNKWILEYNLEQQVSLFRSATEPFARRGEGAGARFSPALKRALKYALVVTGLVLVLGVLFRRVRFEPVSLESRIYLGLRRSYEKAGFEVHARAAPMMFVDTLARARAPGHEAVRRAVELYLRSRFGGEDIGAAGQRELSALAEQARRALRAA